MEDVELHVCRQQRNNKKEDREVSVCVQFCLNVFLELGGKRLKPTL